MAKKIILQEQQIDGKSIMTNNAMFVKVTSNSREIDVREYEANKNSMRLKKNVHLRHL